MTTTFEQQSAILIRINATNSRYFNNLKTIQNTVMSWWLRKSIDILQNLAENPSVYGMLVKLGNIVYYEIQLFVIKNVDAEFLFNFSMLSDTIIQMY